MLTPGGPTGLAAPSGWFKMPNRRAQRRGERIRRLVAGAIVVAVAGTGCKTTGKGDGGTGNTQSDPIFGRNIPKQDIPIPGKDGYGADARDPLFRNNHASRDGDRFDREPYRPTAGTTPAALAARNRDDQASIPSLDDRPTGTPTGRNPAPFRPATDDSGSTLDQALDDLRRLGVKWSTPRRGANGETVIECDLPLGPNGEGPFRRYEGVGPSDAVAARDALRQIKSESSR
jgi:hypothetical protein